MHVNFSLVIIPDGCLDRWLDCSTTDSEIGPAAEAQFKAEVILLTHNERLYDVHLGWHPTGEELL